MKKLSLWLCIWFWWRRVIVRVLKITKITLKTVLKEGKSSILHRVVKSARFDPHRARNCARFLQTLRVAALHRALLFLAAPRRVRPLLTTETTTIKPYPTMWGWLHGSNDAIVFYQKPYLDLTH